MTAAAGKWPGCFPAAQPGRAVPRPWLRRRRRSITAGMVGQHHSSQESTHETWRMQIRPVGSWPGCLLMILFSVVASIVGTVLLNLLLR